jgi:hypothetical protein
MYSSQGLGIKPRPGLSKLQALFKHRVRLCVDVAARRVHLHVCLYSMGVSSMASRISDDAHKFKLILL